MQSYDENSSYFRVSIMIPTTKAIRVKEMSADAIIEAIEMLKSKVSEDL